MKAVWKLLKDAVSGWSDHNAARLGAALSYYTIFALPPLFVILIFIASLCLNEETVRTQLFGQMGGLIGTKGAGAIESALKASNPQKQGIIASIIAIGALILTATGLFIELQGDLNKIWGVKTKEGQGIWGFVKIRVLSFGVVVGIGFLLLVSLVISTALSAAGKYFTGLAPGMNVLWMAVNFVFSLLVIAALFAMIFKILPDVKIAWRDTWVGAGLTALLFTIGKFLIGLYLGKNSAVSAYGTAGSLVLILLWVYYSAQILFFGAELTRIYANRYGQRLQLKPHAEWVSPPPEKAGAEKTGRTKASVRVRPEKGKKGKGGKKEQLLGELQEEVDHLRELVER